MTRRARHDFAAYLRRERQFSRLPSEHWATDCYAGISPFHGDQRPLHTLGSGYQAAPGEFTLGSDRAALPPHIDRIGFELAAPVTAG